MARTYRCTFRGHHANGVLVQPSVHYQTDLATGGSEPDPIDVAERIWAHIGGEYMACTSSDVTIDEFVVGEEVVKPDIGVAGAKLLGFPGIYPLAGGQLPHAMVPVINFHTATRSKSARGWAMLGGPRRDELIAGDNWNSTTSWWAAMIAFCQVLNDSIEWGDVFVNRLEPVVYSRIRHQSHFAPWTFPVTSVTPNPQVRWLKSRLTSP